MTAPFVDYAFLTTGATTTRTLPARLGEVANVKDFGATGDGVTDDWAAIMAAYNKGQVTLVATAPSSGNIITFASVPATVVAGMFAVDVTDSSAFAAMRVGSTTATTVTLADLSGTGVEAGDTITFNTVSRGLLYFPHGTYLVSAPIDINPASTNGISAYIGITGVQGASTIVGNFADYIIKRGLRGGQEVGAFFVEKLTLVNSHADGGGIRMGSSTGIAVRDCDITANHGLATNDSDTTLDGEFWGTFEFAVANCHFRAYDVLAAGSVGFAVCGDGPIINCTFKDFDKGAQTFGGQGSSAFYGCLFEHNNYGLAAGWGPGQATWGQTGSNSSAISAHGCRFKDNGVAVLDNGGTCIYRGIFIEASEGAIIGNPQYGIYTPRGGRRNVYSGIRITGQYEVAGFAVPGTTILNTSSIDGVQVSNTSTLGGVNWILPTMASTAHFTGCNVAAVYTMAELPAFPVGTGIREASWSAGITTLRIFFTMTTINGDPITVAVSGLSVPGFNGTFTGVTVTGPDTIAYAQSDPGGGPIISGGPPIGQIIWNASHAAKEGDCFNVSDADTAVWGDLPFGGGSTHAKLRWGASDTAWTVVGK